MSGLILTPNLADPDAFYAALVATHQGLSDEESELLNARLVLILANHVGEEEVLREALDLARRTFGEQGRSTRPQATADRP